MKGGELYMGYQKYQQICLNGHQKTIHSETFQNPNQFCTKCGESIISCCPNCSSGILGYKEIPGVLQLGVKKKIPYYCNNCGKPYPWTNALIKNVDMILSLDSSISSIDKDFVTSSIPHFINETPTTPVSVVKTKTILTKASTIVKDSMYKILIDVVSESVKKSLF